jgi:XTP/dITP diphosphohydrolase
VSGLLHYSSSNPGKLREFALAAKDAAALPLVVAPLPALAEIPAPAEDASSFEGNAVAKAGYYSGFSSALVLADDSGLEVEALGGEPGVHSARHAGMGASDLENNELVLRRMQGQANRSARFVCVLALARAGQIIQTFRGTVEGEILDRMQGSNGFGYDPLFFYPPFGRSFGELAVEEKFAVSHRGKALKALLEYLHATGAA